jgi:cobalt-zinc-cadmium efflux system protein
MTSGHVHPKANYNRAFAVGIALNVVYVIVEGVFGWMIGSLALLADAGHNLSDVLGLLLAWGAHGLGQAKPGGRRTYGWRSSSILAALFNALLLLAAVGGILWEAVQRFATPAPTAGWTIVAVATAGVVVNTLTALLFASGRKGDLNIRGAFLHMAADAAVSAGVIVAGLAIQFTGWPWIDPAVSIAIALVILYGTWELLRDSIDLSLHAVPKGIDIEEVRAYLAELPGVEAVHDLHIWAMSTTEAALTVHLVKPKLEDEDSLLAGASAELHRRFRIEHVTIQIERIRSAAWCKQAPEDTL